jgi:hypothetical protein
MIYELLCLFALGGFPAATRSMRDRGGNEKPPALIYDFPRNKSHQPIIVVVSGYNQETNILTG